jgi:glycerol-3-phosphate dehydrogenase
MISLANQRRKLAFEHLAQGQFDLVVIGGGASGAGAALDAAQRGLHVALIERVDWAQGTSSRSTKLLHGGVRYLEQAFKHFDFKQLRQVRHGLAERSTVMAAAPFLAYPLTLITPVFSFFEGLYLALGLKIYSLIAGRRDTMPPTKWLSRRSTLAQLPMLSANVHSGVQYYDGQFDDARYCLLLVRKAQELGAICLNDTAFSAFGFDAQGAINTVQVTDQLTGASTHIQTRTVLNATGPWSDTVRLAANSTLPPRMAASKGVHLTLPLPDGMTSALMIPKTRDGRVLFAIPFQGVLMLGTTDTAYQNLEQEPKLEHDETLFLLETLNAYVAQPYQESDVRAGFGGLRPLIAEAGRGSTKQLLRDHEIETDVVSGLVSLLGGKWTTYRLMAQDAIDEICRLLQQEDLVCRTEVIKLPGTIGWLPDGYKLLHKRYADDISGDTAKHLHRTYGHAAYDVMAICKEDASFAEPLCANAPYIRAEVIWHARHEMALHISDVLARRLRLQYTDKALALEAAPVVARLMADELDWSGEQEKAYLKQYLLDLK